MPSTTTTTATTTTTTANTPPAPPTPTTTADADVISSTEPEETSSLDAFGTILQQLDELAKSQKALKKLVQDTKAKCAREIKLLNKSIAKKKPRKQSDKPTGFRKPGGISAELANFFGIPETQMMARIDVTNAINAYVVEHDLQNPANRRTFILDKTEPGKKMLDLLKPHDGVDVGYFNLQKWLAPHFIKTVVVQEVVPSAAPAEVVTKVIAPVEAVTKVIAPIETAPTETTKTKKRVRTGGIGRRVEA